MGWFLGSSTKKKKKAAAPRKTQPAVHIQWDPQKTLFLLELGGWAVLLAGLTFGWFYGERALQSYAAEHRRATPKVELRGVPGEWMPPTLMEEITGVVANTVDPNPFSADTLQETATELQSNPWVKQVHSVRRKPNGVIEVSAVYRTPAAFIEYKTAYHLIDDKGVRLPLVYDDIKPVAKLGLPVLRGVKSAPAPAGVQWPGADVTAGLDLARLVAAQPWGDQVKAIDVTNFGGRVSKAQPHLALVTREGLVRWGRPPGEEEFYEPSTNVKLEHIKNVMRKHKSIDAGGRTVDVYGDQALIHGSAEAVTARYTQP
jgi:hypothetical protein